MKKLNANALVAAQTVPQANANCPMLPPNAAAAATSAVRVGDPILPVALQQGTLQVPDALEQLIMDDFC